jgi:hypothetical protein
MATKAKLETASVTVENVMDSEISSQTPKSKDTGKVQRLDTGHLTRKAEDEGIVQRTTLCG